MNWQVSGEHGGGESGSGEHGGGESGGSSGEQGEGSGAADMCIGEGESGGELMAELMSGGLGGLSEDGEASGEAAASGETTAGNEATSDAASGATARRQSGSTRPERQNSRKQAAKKDKYAVLSKRTSGD